MLSKLDLTREQEDGGTPQLYKLTVKPDDAVRVDIDEEKIYERSIKENWKALKRKKTSDHDVKKLSDWADDGMMDDPAGGKHEDWTYEKRIVAMKKLDDWNDEKVSEEKWLEEQKIGKVA